MTCRAVVISPSTERGIVKSSGYWMQESVKSLVTIDTLDGKSLDFIFSEDGELNTLNMGGNGQGDIHFSNGNGTEIEPKLKE